MERISNMKSLKMTSRAALLAVCAFLIACGGGGQADEPSSAPRAEVSLKNIAFDPPTLEVSVGEEVVWVNNDEAIKHTVTAGKPGTDEVPGATEAKPAKLTGEFDSGTLQTGDDFTFAFDEEGTYAYFCEIHPSMTAEISVGS